MRSYHSCLLPLLVACLQPLAATEPDAKPEDATEHKQQLTDMNRAAAQYVFSPADALQHRFDFRETPLLRFTNPVSGTDDGALYVWTRHGRPEVALKLFTTNSRIFDHVCLSLSEHKIVGERNGQPIWHPTKPGLRFREIPDAPEPAKTSVERLRQMKSLADRFTATYAVGTNSQPSALRLLSQPIYRYESETPDRADGALFCYVQGTSPVGLLLLESRPTPAGMRWQSAFASLVRGPVVARYRDIEIASFERKYAFKDPRQTHVIFHSMPVPTDENSPALPSAPSRD